MRRSERTPLDEPALSTPSSPRGSRIDPGLNREVRPGVARMLIGDAYIATLLLGKALRRIAGVRTNASLLTTLFVLGVLANALRRIAAPALKTFRPRLPSFAGTMMVLAFLREIPGSIAGVPARDKPFTGTLIAVGLAAPAPRRIARPTLRALAALAAFAKGYGRS
jgi:hypothetical protein